MSVCQRCEVFRALLGTRTLVGADKVLCDGCMGDAIVFERERCAKAADAHHGGWECGCPSEIAELIRRLA